MASGLHFLRGNWRWKDRGAVQYPDGYLQFFPWFFLLAFTAWCEVLQVPAVILALGLLPLTRLSGERRVPQPEIVALSYMILGFGALLWSAVQTFQSTSGLHLVYWGAVAWGAFLHVRAFRWLKYLFAALLLVQSRHFQSGEILLIMGIELLYVWVTTLRSEQERFLFLTSMAMAAVVVLPFLSGVIARMEPNHQIVLNVAADAVVDDWSFTDVIPWIFSVPAAYFQYQLSKADAGSPERGHDRIHLVGALHLGLWVALAIGETSMNEPMLMALTLVMLWSAVISKRGLEPTVNSLDRVIPSFTRVRNLLLLR
ncbi:hypothetical protein E3A20_04850 [Planctomyces bekefii]|uniref:Uncharacterized protein n=1 Tax=Planctomyces bekefii TaxID=1653850 RepID=A0A5C6MBS8_9PLAN|nr:hypothetical protein E3A20_04850 [Planctomyces bekefii]